MKHYLVEKSYARALVIGGLLYVFATGMLVGFLLSFVEVEARFHRIRQSLEETARWKP